MPGGVGEAMSTKTTMTCRPVEPQPKNERVGMVNAAYAGMPEVWLVNGAVSEYTCHGEVAPEWSPPYSVGDILQVKGKADRIRVTSIRAERVQDISTADCHCEGYATSPEPKPDSRDWFANLWDSIYFSKGLGWGVNPWVWVYGFEAKR